MQTPHGPYIELPCWCADQLQCLFRMPYCVVRPYDDSPAMINAGKASIMRFVSSGDADLTVALQAGKPGLNVSCASTTWPVATFALKKNATAPPSTGRWAA